MKKELTIFVILFARFASVAQQTPAWLFPNKVSIISALLFRLSLLINIGLFIQKQAVSQCVADAGGDTSICIGLYGIDTSIYLGGNPTAQGGNPPYSYIWETWYQGVFASGFLNDTTLANPKLIWGGNLDYNKITFHLTVIDSNGLPCYDSIIIHSSRFCFSLTDKYATINAGDSVLLWPGVGCGAPPLSYHWIPEDYLSNPYIPNPWAKPNTTITYTAIITDSLGCQGVDEPFEVYIIPTAVEEYSNENNTNIAYFHFKYNQEIEVVISTGEILKIEIFDILGRVLFTAENVKDENLSIKIYNLSTGLFFYRIISQKNIEYGKFIIN